MFPQTWDIFYHSDFVNNKFSNTNLVLQYLNLNFTVFLTEEMANGQEGKNNYFSLFCLV